MLDKNGKPIERRDCQNERGPFVSPKEQRLTPVTISERPGCLGETTYALGDRVPVKTTP